MQSNRLLFSKTTNGFYDTSLNYSAIPADAVEITPDEHATLLDAQRLGEQIVGDANGRPVAVPRET